jgi:archaellum biogenesis ATPase FlaH
VGIPISIPGLNQFIREVPEGSIISIEGGVDPPKSVMVGVVASTAKENGWNISYICPRGRCGSLQGLSGEWKEGMSFVEGDAPTLWKDHIKSKNLLIIDSLSYLLQEKDISEFKRVMEEVKFACNSCGAIVIQLVELGMLDKWAEILSGFYADGIVQFLSKDAADGLTRFVRIPKWMSGASYDRNIYYTYEEGRINIDLRYRVV